ncbi:restriction endonuclease subunit S [Sphingomonas nostoxanthinifaciens]|uniref:restriction endonuclease subunit S n=1 Tax=Sphingomonas nostoxanthinifaciens TaxID=2872652 RepID=UPI001CC1ED8A|nr:restriction endonuclease subunit S [Sphingomonas nostoxanthinifaciens]UAK25748.1 restriction endonuclease subunit S [Sphingomonas nostoxanthinifaciens]
MLSKVVRIITDGISSADLAALPEIHHYSLPAFDERAGPEVVPGEAIKSNKTVVPDDCVLFSKLNPRIPRIWRVRGDAPSHSYCSTEFWPLVAQGSGIDLDYLTQYLSSAAFLGHRDITPSSSTNSHQRVDRKAFERFEFALPPLDEQRRIAEVLRSVDEAIAATNAVATSMLCASKTMRHELLNVAPDGTTNDLPPGWTVASLERLARIERGKFSIRPRNDPRYFGGSTPFIQTGDITAAGDYITRHTQTLNELGVGVSRVFAAGTIMTTIAANIGDFAIASYQVACPDSVVGIEANADVDPFWLYSVLTCFKAALDRAATQNAQKNINLQTLRPLQVPVPPPALMIELAETLAAAAGGALHTKASATNLTAMKQSLMADLLSGRVRIPA